MSPKKTILIVEDNAVNRAILCKILSQDYFVKTAENGQEALEILKNSRKDIAGIVLDLIMPVMDGYTFLKEMSKRKEYTEIPVVVATEKGDVESEKQTLQLGAWDFISKPYDADILKFRLKNAIDRSRLVIFEQLQYLAEYDTLTNIYNKQKLLAMTKELLEDNPREKFVFIRFDIVRFQLVNSFYGTAVGDDLLRYVAKNLKEQMLQLEKSAYGRIEGDAFGCCIPYRNEQQIRELIESWRIILSQFPIDFRLIMAFGLYKIQDKGEDPNTILDKANLAERQIKGNYVKNYAYYSQKMSETIAGEQRIVNEMNKALEQEQFDIYLQPKYNLQKRRIEGAEALVRWIHPERGILVPPGDFIPVFERNGFITRLDYYVWEKVCKLLRKWIDAGHNPDPISVNMSRVDLYSPNLIENICNLTQTYRVPSRLLQFELTESACAENEYLMRDVTEKLRSRGFTILMDDFGSAYSSLNILKDLEIDILKIDMRFLVDMSHSERARDILESVILMAKKLQLPVIVEGVETREQAAAMAKMGCEYAQGYYFARPMPVSEYEIFTGTVQKNKSENLGGSEDEQRVFEAIARFEM